MAITFRSFASINNVNVSSLTANKPTGTVDGDFLIATFAGGTFSNSSTVVVTPPAGWTSLISVEETDHTYTMQIFYKFASGEPTTYAFTFTGGGVGGADQNQAGVLEISCYQNINTDVSIEASTSFRSLATLTNVSAPAITTQSSGADVLRYWFAHAGAGNSPTWTVPGGVTSRDSEAFASQFCFLATDEIQAVAGAATTRTASISSPSNTADAFVAVSVVLRDVAVGIPLVGTANIATTATANLTVRVPGGAAQWKETQTSFATATSAVCNKPTDVVAGDLLLAHLVAGNFANTGPVTWTAPAGWTLVAEKAPPVTNPDITARVYKKIATGGETSTYTWTFTGGGGLAQSYHLAVSSYSGVDNTSPIDGTTTSYLPGGQTAIPRPPLATQSPLDLIVQLFACRTAAGTGPLFSNPSLASGRWSHTDNIYTVSMCDTTQTFAGLTSEEAATLSAATNEILTLTVAVRSSATTAVDTTLVQAGVATTWKPGATYNGGIPNYPQFGSVLMPSGTSNDSAAIQTALDNCPTGNAVVLGPGVFQIPDILFINKSVVLRGQWPGDGIKPNTTLLNKANGADFSTLRIGANATFEADPLIIIGKERFTTFPFTANLTANTVKGTFTAVVNDVSGFTVGDVVLVDELIDSSFISFDPGDTGLHAVWCRLDRPRCEWKEISAINTGTKTLTFTTPFHAAYRVTTFTGQISRSDMLHVKNAGVENVGLRGGGDSNIKFAHAAKSWVKNVESTFWIGEGISMSGSLQCELRDSFCHDGAWPAPGGAGYSIEMSFGSADCLIENNISMSTVAGQTESNALNVGVNKVIVSRCAGAGCVVAYNYFDNGFINYNMGWQEVGLNASHMVGNHHVLLEGNWAWNADADKTHGSNSEETFFRNYLSGLRSMQFFSPANGNTTGDVQNVRCVGLAALNSKMSFIGNVLGIDSSAWRTKFTIYDDAAPFGSSGAIWRIGYNDSNFAAAADATTVATTQRDGNWDYLTNSVHWHTSTETAIPASYYITTKPSFFIDAEPWPWVDPIATTKVYELPAKRRFDNLVANGYVILPELFQMTWNPGIPNGIPTDADPDRPATIYLPPGDPYAGYSINPALTGVSNAAAFKTAFQTAVDAAGEQATGVVGDPNCRKIILIKAGTYYVPNSTYVSPGNSYEFNGTSLEGGIFVRCSNVTIRGEGFRVTRIAATGVIHSFGAVISFGHRTGRSDDSDNNVQALTAGAVRGQTTIQVANASGYSVGDVITLDRENGPIGATQLGASVDPHYLNDDLLWMWDGAFFQRQPSHDWNGPSTGAPDVLAYFAGVPFDLTAVTTAATSYFPFYRTISQMSEITAIVGNTLTLKDPIHIALPLARNPQAWITIPANPKLPAYIGNRWNGIEHIAIAGGNNEFGFPNGCISFSYCAYSWAKDVEGDGQVIGGDTTKPGKSGYNIGVGRSYRCVVRDSYFHHSTSMNPGGTAYGIVLLGGAGHNLVENNISIWNNKPVNLLNSGGGNVVSYNYVDNAIIDFDPTWQESAIDENHGVFSHNDLIEGNWTPNIGSDSTHGNSGFHVHLRNYCIGRNTDWLTTANVADVRMMGWTDNFAFIGNVLKDGQVYDDLPWAPAVSQRAIWQLGNNAIGAGQFDNGWVAARVYRHGNWDNVTSGQVWDPLNWIHSIPNSFYLNAKPGFFGVLQWPFVDPFTGTNTELPAHARYATLTTPQQNFLADAAPLQLNLVLGEGVTLKHLSVDNPAALAQVIDVQGSQCFAIISAGPQYGVIGSVVKLDGRSSYSERGEPLAYTWTFNSVPIGSRVGLDGFKVLETETDPNAPVPNSPSVVSFSPDVLGEYEIGLVVSNKFFTSEMVATYISIRAIMVPHARGLVPDGKFIWSYLRDVWTQVDNKQWFETFWSALIQLVGSEMLKLYQIDFNKSIRDIQDYYQRRWLSYEPRLALDETDLSLVLGNQVAGVDASSAPLGQIGEIAILDANNVIVVNGKVQNSAVGKSLTIFHSLSPVNIKSYVISGVNAAKNGYVLTTVIPSPTSDRVAAAVTFTFSFQSTAWTPSISLAAFTPGLIIYYASGLNKGYYRVSSINTGAGTVIVDRAPPSFSDATTSITYKTTVYSPAGVSFPVQTLGVTDTFAIPISSSLLDLTTLTIGRIITFAGRAYTITRVVKDLNEVVPVYLISVQDTVIPIGTTSASWRIPNTLISESNDFDALGVSPGDLLLFDVTRQGSNSSAEIVAQVVGVNGNHLGFVITDEALTGGVVPPIANDNYLSVSKNLALNTVTENPDGTLTFSGFAQSLLTEASSLDFQRSYWNVPLTHQDDIEVGNILFRLHPKAIVRNRCIPVDVDLKSVPVLQEYIKQPELRENGDQVLLVRDGVEIPIDHKPVVLIENSDYVIDDGVAFSGKITITTGTSFFEAEGMDFIDKGLVAGDSIEIEAPLSLLGTYIIESVISNTKVKLASPIPLVAFNNGLMATKIKIHRLRSGTFIRLVPGLYGASNPAPSRFWGEVSFFDNSQTVEDNFGILVGLTRDDLSKISETASYRQAVTGLMYAMTQGSALSKIRLGMQILLGLPFAEHKGIIRSIEEDYRLDDNGTPVAGRIFIEDIDSSNVPLGTFRIYIYPIDVNSFDLSGVETNPATGETYEIGDVVEQFASLCKGVAVDDYLSAPFPFISPTLLLQKYHHISVRANDNIFSIGELDIISSFLKKITPSYIAFVIMTDAEFIDVPGPTEEPTLRPRFGNGILVDNPALGLSTPLMYGSRSGKQNIPLVFGDNVYTLRRAGSDLVTNGFAATSATGGFLNPVVGESFDAGLGLCRTGDILYIPEGDDAGFYPVVTVNTDTLMTLTATFNGATNSRFAVLRAVSPILRDKVRSAALSSGATSIVIDGGLLVDGVRPGDWLIIGDTTTSSKTSRHLITSVTSTSGSFNTINFTPALTYSVSTTYRHVIYRPVIGGLYSALTFGITGAGTNTVTFTATTDGILRSFLEPFDELEIQSTLARHVIIDPATMYVIPTLGAGTYTARVVKNGRASGSSFVWDSLAKKDPEDVLTLSLKSSVSAPSSLTTSNGSNVVTISAGGTTAAVLATLRLGYSLTFNNLTSGGSGTETGGPYGIIGISGSTLTTTHTATSVGTYHFTITRSA